MLSHFHQVYNYKNLFCYYFQFSLFTSLSLVTSMIAIVLKSLSLIKLTIPRGGVLKLSDWHSTKQRRLVAALIGWAHQYFNKLINLKKIINISSEFSAQGQHRSFTANSGTKAAVLPKGRSSTANSGTKLQF